jgi:hypothetical protein
MDFDRAVTARSNVTLTFACNKTPMGMGYLAEGHRQRVVGIAGIAAIARHRRDRKAFRNLPNGWHVGSNSRQIGMTLSTLRQSGMTRGGVGVPESKVIDTSRVAG